MGRPAQVEVTVNRARCIASKCCVNLAPGVFELDATRVANVKDGEGAALDTVIEAAENCPTAAISVVLDGVKLA